MEKMTTAEEKGIEIQATFTANFTMIQNELFDSLAFDKPIDKLLYGALLRFAFHKGFAFPSLSRLAAMCCAQSVRTVHAAMKRLVNMGLVTVQERKKEDNPKENDTNIYFVHDLTPEIRENSVDNKQAISAKKETDKQRKEEKKKRKAVKKLSTEQTEKAQEGVQPHAKNAGGDPVQNLHDPHAKNAPKENQSNKTQFLKEYKDIDLEDNRKYSPYHPNEIMKINKLENTFLKSFLLEKEGLIKSKDIEPIIDVWTQYKRAIKGEAKAEFYSSIVMDVVAYEPQKFARYLKKSLLNAIKEQPDELAQGSSTQPDEMTMQDMLEYINKQDDVLKQAAQIQLDRGGKLETVYQSIKRMAERKKGA